MLKIRIHKSHIEISQKDLTKIEKALSFAIDRFEHVLKDVVVTLTDVNGPKGGVDKRCSVQLRLNPRGLVVVRSNGASLLHTVNDVCNKIQIVLSKRLSKRNAQNQPGYKHLSNLEAV